MKVPNDLTSKMRLLYGALFTVVVLTGLAGWFLGRDPTQLVGILSAVTLAAGIGEAAGVGKRATYNPAADRHGAQEGS